MRERVLLTRAQEDCDLWRPRLEQAGFSVVSFPCVAYRQVCSQQTATRLCRVLPDVRWVLFSSVRAVQFFHAVLTWEMDLDGSRQDAKNAKGALTSDLAPLRLGAKTMLPPLFEKLLGCVGPETKAACTRLFGAPRWVAKTHSAQGLLAVLPKQPPAGLVLLPSARGALCSLALALRQRGCVTWQPKLYETYCPDQPLPTRRFDYATFASPSAVHGFFARARLPFGCEVISIGPSTSAALCAHGVTHLHEAKTHSMAGIAETLEEIRCR